MHSGKEPQKNTLGRLLEEKARQHKDKPFCCFNGDVLTYEDADRQANRVANALVSLGLKKDDTLGIFMPNNLTYFPAIFGSARAGTITVPLNIHHKGNILAYMINHSDMETLIIAKDLLDRLQDIADDLEHLKTVIVYPDSENIDPMRFNIISWPEMLNHSDQTPDVDVQYYDTLLILFTSGTTGMSKGVMMPHNQLFFTAEHETRALGKEHWGRVYNWGPMFHQFGWAMTMAVLLTDSTMYLVETFSLNHYWEDIKRWNITTSGVLGPVMQIMLSAPEKPDDADQPIRKMLGGFVPKAIHESFEKRYNCKIADVFGLTEVEPIGIQDFNNRKLGSIGKGCEDFEIRIVDDNDNEVGPEQAGEIVVRPIKPFTMMKGYYKQPDKTLEAFRNLWFHTGDAAYRDKDGYIFFVDRKKDAIRRRGENISSQELENIINSHPEVNESAAVPVPSELGEDDVKVVVKLNQGEKLAPEVLLEFCQAKMAYFMIPRYVEFVDEFPRTQLGKIQKAKLKTITAATWDREAAGFRIKR